ncbi:MAG TPA: hypothetical protein VGH66_05770, partial [Acidimicrobiales bacterium]
AILAGPFALAALEIYKHWSDVKAWAQDAFNFIAGLWGGLESVLEAPFKAALDTITRIWNDTIGKLKLPSLPGAGAVGGALHAIGLQTGGIVTSPTLALIGENGPEAVVPLSHGMPSGGPALVIQNATFNQPADVDMVMAKAEFAVSAGRL